MLKAMWTIEAQLKRFQKCVILATGLETTLVIFWNVTDLSSGTKNLPEIN